MIKSVTLDVAQVRTERAFEAVAKAIEAKILTGEWSVGSALPGEFALAAAFGVHRSTMREAIRALEQEGLVRRRQGGKQLLVNAPASSHVASRMTAAIVLQEVSFRELWETMLFLEPAAAEAAAMRASETEIAELEENLEASRQALDDPEQLVVLDMDFLAIIARASGNRVLQLCRAPIGQLLYPAFMPVMRRPPAGPRLLAAHAALLKAIKARKPEDARAWMHRHVVDFRRGYEAAGLDIEKPVGWPAR
jgi:GntR family transcriptional regulator, transcriptional repressor for pyruvate dehydrogenase complex